MDRPGLQQLLADVEAGKVDIIVVYKVDRLPPSFPPVTTVQRYFYAWRDSGLLETINHELLMEVRQAMGREASPSAGVIDSQSVKTTESGGPQGYDAGKRSKAASVISSPIHKDSSSPLKDALSACGKWTIEIIKRSDTAKGFVLLPRRWVVERTCA